MKHWWLDEVAHAGDEHLDPEFVAGYDRKAGFDPTEDVETLKALGLGSNSTVVDLGAGSGLFALAVASHCRRVIAVDISPAMRSVLARRVAERSIENVTVVDAGFLSYGHAGPPAEFAYTRNALHHLPDFWKGVALQRVASVLRPGGILRLRDLIYDFAPDEADERIEEWLAGAVNDPANGWTRDELAQHVRQEHSTYAWLLEPMLERAGFEIIDRHFRRSVYGAYTCRRC
jgi:ubiquinone/menaquinone biosynthesis C-methylase UbiE